MENIAVRIWLRAILLLLLAGVILDLIISMAGGEYSDFLSMAVPFACLALLFALPHLVAFYCLLVLTRRFMHGKWQTMILFLMDAVFAAVAGTVVDVLALSGGIFSQPCDWSFLLLLAALSAAAAVISMLSYHRLIGGYIH